MRPRKPLDARQARLVLVLAAATCWACDAGPAVTSSQLATSRVDAPVTSASRRQDDAQPSGSGTPPLPTGVGGRPFQRGMVYGVFSRSGRDFHRTNLKAMRALGVDSIEIVVPRTMATVRSTSLSAANPWVTPSRESLEQAVAEAHRLGMRVLLFPIVFIEELEGDEWRGALAPRDWELWWRNYAAFILAEARWAERHAVEMLSVGSELSSAERFTQHWVDLIAEVRQVYSGLVTYSANWDHLQSLEFAARTDFIGMNAYHEIGSAEPDLETMVRRWNRILREVQVWQATHGRPVVVTEIGYQSRRGTTLYPWDYLAGGPADPAEQDLGYRAFIQAWSGMPWLAGTYFYLWWDEQDGGRGYTPRGKPAGRTLKRWYTQR